MWFSEFPFLRYTLFFILGILVYPLVGIWTEKWYWLVLAALISIYILLIAVNTYRSKFLFKTALPALAYLILVISGIFFTSLKDSHNTQNHIVNFDQPVTAYVGLVLSIDVARPNSTANRLSLKWAYGEHGLIPVQGEILIYHRCPVGLNPGELILVKGAPQRILPPSNPGEFDYRKFMIRQQISHQHFAGEQLYKLGILEEQPVENLFLGIRSEIMNQMDRYILDSRANQIAKALLLGQKKNLEKELNEAYVTAGAMHILAVSGLHVGIIYGFFFLFVKPFRLSTGKRIVYLSLIISLIWGYALLTGLSPSVMRAATMFTLMGLAQMKSRNPSVYNPIALSALLLLVYDPFLIHSVGFQLSYAALLGILLFQPLIVSLWLPKNRILEYVWQITAVGFAAQLATFPISVHYFHVFPTYFPLANLIAIPGAFLIMSIGVPFMIFSRIPWIGELLGWLTEKLIIIVNNLIFSVQLLPKARISDIYFDPAYLGLYWLLLAMGLLVWILRKKWPLYVAVSAMLAVGIFRAVQVFLPDGRQQVLAYAPGNGIALDYFDGKSWYFWQSEVSESNLSYRILPNRLHRFSGNPFPLEAVENSEGGFIPLPGNTVKVRISEGHLGFDHLSQSAKIFHWQQDDWVPLEGEDAFPFGETAIKIILN